LEFSQFPRSEIATIKPEAVLMGQMGALFSPELTKYLIQQKRTAFSMELVPRTTRAQSMDVLSSMATVTGYKAVLMAANLLPRFFPMFMTAAGSITPARVLILGAGVAGLQAIATARRLGASVFAFDVRQAAKEEVLSLGAKFVDVEGAKEDKGAGGYAVEQTPEYIQKQKDTIHEHATKADIIITTAQIPGRKAPQLVEERTVLAMKPGSVIIDLAASSGGNCALSKPDQTIEVNGVRIVGVGNLAADMPQDASKMYGKNYLNFLKLIIKDGNLNLNFEDDIVTGTCVCHAGNPISPESSKCKPPDHGTSVKLYRRKYGNGLFPVVGHPPGRGSDFQCSRNPAYTTDVRCQCHPRRGSRRCYHCDASGFS
jgi:H+-translocating NAD(P) transhydrogenase subunit alpha